MTCREIQADLQGYLDGELSPVRRTVIEDHVSLCSDCRRVIVELRTTSKVLGAWSDHPVPEGSKVALHARIAVEQGQARTKNLAPERARGGGLVVYQPLFRRGFLRWVTSGWRPVAVAAVVLVGVGLTFLARDTRIVPRIARKPQRQDALATLSARSETGQVTDGCIYADFVAIRALAAPQLDVSRVASCDVVAMFLSTVQTESDRTAGRRLLNLLAGNAHGQGQAGRQNAAVWRLPSLLFRTAHAVQSEMDPLLTARQFELQGRPREALDRYRELAQGGLWRAIIAEGTLSLRMGDLDVAQAAFKRAEAGPDRLVRASAQALATEVARAREARLKAAALKSTAVSAQEWHSTGLAEIEAYDFRTAANSFMKAANDAGSSQDALAQDARFRSAWCQKEIGQISTAAYGFKAVFENPRYAGSMAYAAGIEQAVALSRMARFEESVQVCGQVLKRPSDDHALEALVYFHKGCVELRCLRDPKAASESLKVVSASGQGSLSYAALVLLQSSAAQ